MDIQHKDLPDSELHDVKGATSASVGSVLVSDGVGNTSFSKLGVANFTGSVPDNIPDIVLATDGSGGFKVRQETWGQLKATRADAFTEPVITANGTIQGVYISGNGFKVNQVGNYMILSQGPLLENTSPDPLPANLSLKNQIGTIVFSGISGTVQLNTSDTYFLSNNLFPSNVAVFSVVRFA